MTNANAHTIRQSAELIIELPFLDNPGREGIHRSALRPSGRDADPQVVPSDPRRELTAELPLLPDDLSQLDRPLAGASWRIDAEEAIAGVLSVWGTQVDADEVLGLLVNFS